MGRRTVLLCAFAMLAVGCDDVSAPRGRLVVRGVITSREPGGIGVRDGDTVRVEHYARMLVEGRPFVEWGGVKDVCQRSAWFSIPESTPIVRRDGGRVTEAALPVGQTVTVWGGNIVLQSCPPQTHADSVVVEGGPLFEPEGGAGR